MARHRRVRRLAGRHLLALAAVAGLAQGALPATAAAVAAPRPASAEALVVDGRGNGHGIGMSQWGAYGFAADAGWNAQQILDHYYGGTVAGTTDATSITVRLMNLDDQQTAVVHDKGQLVVDGVAGGPWRSVVVREVTQRSYTVWARADAAVCPGGADPLTSGWAVVAAGLPSVTVRPATDTSASGDVGDLAAVCEPGGRVRSYRGVIRAVNGTANENRTVNEVPLEQYLRAVVASEMSPSWASKGLEALRAQAVAARSFGLAESRYSYAKTCDQICQYYPGAAWRAGVGGTLNRTEHASTDGAVQSTAAQVRRVGSAAGPVALTMFSSSSGGWTAASTLPFPAVADPGDATAANPHHRWTVTVPRSVVEQAWPSIGTFTGLAGVQRSGQGEWGGRVISLTVVGTAGSVKVGGDTFRRALGLRSNWFDVRGAAAPAPAPAPSGPGGGCGTRLPPPITGAYQPGPAARYAPRVPERLIDTRDGTGTAVAPLLAGCTLVVAPPVPAGTTAVTINVVTVESSAQGFLAAYPCGIDRPFTSIVQSRPGSIVSGSAIVPLAANGTFCVFSNITTEVVVDLTGSYAPDAPAGFEPLDTQRRFDSRPGGSRLGAGSVVRVGTRGPGAAPADSTGASITIHALDAAWPGFVTAWPCDAERPWASSANVDAGGSSANEAVLAVAAATGEVCIYLSAPMHLAVDLNGWFGPTATTTFHAVVPFRLADTREGHGWPSRFAANAGRRIQVAGVGGLPSGGAVRAVAAQATAVGPARAGWATVHPCRPGTPEVSMLRYPAGAIVAAPVNVPLDATGAWCVVASQATDLVVDVFGWYG